MIRVLRTIGILNAALWFGAAVFFTFGVGPAFFSKEMRALLGDAYAGAAVQVVIERYFTLHQVCAVVALIHLVAEALYLGRPIWRWALALLLGLFLLTGVGAYEIQPKLHALHRSWRGPGAPPESRLVAERSFRTWHGVSQALNLVVVAGVLAYLLQVTWPPDETARWRS